MSVQKNKARKAKLDLIASLIEKRNIKWTRREDPGYTFVFIIAGAEIYVSPDEIKMKKGGKTISIIDEQFEKILDEVSENNS